VVGLVLGIELQSIGDKLSDLLLAPQCGPRSEVICFKDQMMQNIPPERSLRKWVRVSTYHFTFDVFLKE